MKNKKQTTPIAATLLASLLADCFVLYVKTLNFHWNMQSKQFFMFHKLLQTQYEELQEAIDLIAERLRMLRHTPPSSMADFLKLATLQESKSNLKDEAMVKALASDHESLVQTCLSGVAICQKAGDEGSADLLIERLRDHDKQAWILRSHL